MGIKRRTTEYLLAAGLSTGISFLTLPLTTRVIGPSAYGRLALVGAPMGIGTTLATLGAGFLIYRHGPEIVTSARSSLLATLVWIALLVIVSWSGILILLFFLLRDSLQVLGELSFTEVGLGLGAMVLSPFWIIATEFLTLQGRSRPFAIATICQTAAAAAATLLSLFVFDLGSLALFIGLFAGSIVTFGAASIVLFPHVKAGTDRRWFGELREMAIHNLFASFTEQGFVLVERISLSTVGLAPLGLYTHSQRYREVAQIAVKSVAKSSWPVTLDEARDTSSDFPVTRVTWQAMHLAITLGGVAFATLGDYAIAFLTNGKFTSAFIFVGPWFIFILLQHASKPQLGTVFSLGDGKTAANLITFVNLSAIVALLPLVAWLGSLGAVIAALVSQLVYRMLVRVVALRYRDTPFNDQWVFFGAALILVILAVKVAADPGFFLSATLFVLTTLACLIAGRRTLTSAAGAVLGRST